MSEKSKTIVLIHGLWMTPRSWENFHGFFRARGYRVLTPGWPRMHDTVSAVRRNPAPLAGLGLTEIADHYEKIIRALPEPPILMGHSMGGLIVQMLVARGLGCAGVAISSATPAGIYRLPWSVIKSGMPVLSDPLNFWRAIALTYPQFRYAFAHVMSEREAQTAYDDYAVPGPGRPIFEVAFGNFNPWAPNRIDFRIETRAPLLFIAGENDHLVPSILIRTNFKLHLQSPAITEFKEFCGRSHLIIAQEGWREVADYALAWTQTTLAAIEEAEAPALAVVR